MRRALPSGRDRWPALPLFFGRRSARMYAAAFAMIIGGATLLGMVSFASSAGATSINANPGSLTFAVAASNPPTALTVPAAGLPSSTQFDIHLPASASCSFPGSSGETYDSFLVPESTDLSTLTFRLKPPQADQGTSPLLANTESFPPAQNPSNSPAGLISPSYLSDVEWDLLIQSGDVVQGTSTNPQLPAGTALIPSGASSAEYEVGVACVASSGGAGSFTGNAITDYWSAPVTFTASTTDPSGFTWAPASTTGTTTTTTTTTATTTTSTSTSTTGDPTTTTTTTASTASHLVITVPTAATVGTAFSFTVDAENASGDVVSGYTDDVAFTSSDSAATLPATSALTDGVGTFTATFNTVGNQTITATDTATSSITGISAAAVVTTAAATTTTTSTTIDCTGATTTTTSTTSTSTSTTSTSSTTSSTSSTTSTTLPCETTTTTEPAGPTTTVTGVTTTAPVVVAPSTGVDPTAATTALPFTGRNVTPEVTAGLFLILMGLLVLAAARRRQEIERLIWPDER